MKKGTFEDFILEIDNLCMTYIGLSSEDLQDFCYIDFYDEGLDPKDVFKEIMLPEMGIEDLMCSI